jgi:hypothetical protein
VGRAQHHYGVGEKCRVLLLGASQVAVCSSGIRTRINRLRPILRRILQRLGRYRRLSDISRGFVAFQSVRLRQSRIAMALSSPHMRLDPDYCGSRHAMILLQLCLSCPSSCHCQHPINCGRYVDPFGLLLCSTFGHVVDRQLDYLSILIIYVNPDGLTFLLWKTS